MRLCLVCPRFSLSFTAPYLRPDSTTDGATDVSCTNRAPGDVLRGSGSCPAPDGRGCKPEGKHHGYTISKNTRARSYTSSSPLSRRTSGESDIPSPWSSGSPLCPDQCSQCPPTSNSGRPTAWGAATSRISPAVAYGVLGVMG